MKVSFNFDTSARRIRLRAEDPLEETVLTEMSLLCSKGVSMKITNLNIGADSDRLAARDEFEIEMRINGFAEGKEKKSE